MPVPMQPRADPKKGAFFNNGLRIKSSEIFRNQESTEVFARRGTSVFLNVGGLGVLLNPCAGVRVDKLF